MLARQPAVGGLPIMPGLPAPGMAPAQLPGAALPGGMNPMGAFPGAAPVSSGGGGAPNPQETKKIFVGGLSHETSEADFNAYFGTSLPPLRPDYLLPCRARWHGTP
jgi:hypothetical protein